MSNSALPEGDGGAFVHAEDALEKRENAPSNLQANRGRSAVLTFGECPEDGGYSITPLLPGRGCGYALVVSSILRSAPAAGV